MGHTGIFHPGRSSGGMIPPKGFRAELYPLRHRLPFGFALGAQSEAGNTAFMPIVMGSTDMAAGPETIQVNPHNANYEEDIGPLCRQMSIIDKMTISLKFNALQTWSDRAHTSGLSGAEAFDGDGLQALHFLWRPIFGSFTEKLDSVDDESSLTAAAVLGLTHDLTNEDVVPITTNKLNAGGSSELVMPSSTSNDVQVFGDFNMTSNLAMEDHVWDEDIFQRALRRFTNKGAIRSMVGRTRHVTLTRTRPFHNVYINKFVPRAIRRIVSMSFFGIQVHVPFITDPEQVYVSQSLSEPVQIGVKCIAQYHEWNIEHDQDMTA